jgi:hypothetical protein
MGTFNICTSGHSLTASILFLMVTAGKLAFTIISSLRRRKIPTYIESTPMVGR